MVSTFGIGNELHFMDNCNFELDLSGADIKYHDQSIKDTLGSIASICDPSQFMKIAFTTNQGKYGFSVFTDHKCINFKFVNTYEHEYDETHAWLMELGITYRFKRNYHRGRISFYSPYYCKIPSLKFIW